MWEMSCPWAANLPQRVKANTETWLRKVKAVTAAEESAAKLEEIKATATDDAIFELGDMMAVAFDAIAELADMVAGLE